MKADRMGVIVNHRFDRLVLRAFRQIFKPKYCTEAVMTAFNQRRPASLIGFPPTPAQAVIMAGFGLVKHLKKQG